jgi:hypothetical protein
MFRLFGQMQGFEIQRVFRKQKRLNDSHRNCLNLRRHALCKIAPTDHSVGSSGYVLVFVITVTYSCSRLAVFRSAETNPWF